jgi:hypothetical protein
VCVGFPIWAIFLINGVFPLLCMAPFMRDLVEVKTETPPEISVQIRDMWAMVQRRAVWLPCSYIFLYNCLYLTNPAWNSFLVEGLNFSNFDIGVLAIAGTVLSYIGIVIYKKYLFESSWRLIYVGTTVVSAVFSGLQLILVFQLNKKIGMGARGFQLLFAMGSYGMVQFVQAVQFLPACRMFIVMCPVGAEGASYAMLTTLSNLSQSVAYSVAAGCAEIWNVSNSKLEDEEWEGLWKLTLLCACCQVVPLAFIQILPANNEEQVPSCVHSYLVIFSSVLTIICCECDVCLPGCCVCSWRCRKKMKSRPAREWYSWSWSLLVCYLWLCIALSSPLRSKRGREDAPCRPIRDDEPLLYSELAIQLL